MRNSHNIFAGIKISIAQSPAVSAAHHTTAGFHKGSRRGIQIAGQWAACTVPWDHELPYPTFSHSPSNTFTIQTVKAYTLVLQNYLRNCLQEKLVAYIYS